MRVFCFIFIVQVLLVLSQPCDEIFPNLSVSDGSPSQISHSGDRSDCEGSAEECSPFCLCSCCSHPTAAVMISVGVSGEYRSAVNRAVENEYADPYTDAQRNAIWQPPKV